MNDLVAMAQRTKYAELVKDRAQLESLLLTQMKSSNDPMVREIGSGLADGTMNWRTLATNSAYADFMATAGESAESFTLDPARATFEAEAEPVPEKPAPRDPRVEDRAADEPLFRGELLRKRKPRS